MKTYTFFFELFGKNYKYECKAVNEVTANSLLKNFIFSKTKIVKTEIVPVSPESLKKNMADIDSIFKGFDEYFDGFFKKP